MADRNNPLILLVEDNLNDEALALRALKKSGVTHRVVVVRDGREGLDYLFSQGSYSDRHSSDHPAIVLLDLNLPKIGGLDVLRSVRKDDRTRLLPIVILTSSSEERDLSAGYELGTNSYIVKPVDFTRFAEALGQVADYWLTLNRYPSPIGLMA
jgi:two-component system response regulator